MTKEQSLLFYLFTFIISTFLLVFSKKCIKNKIAKKIVLIISLLIPTIIAGIRYGIGTDYHNYIDIFRVVNSNEFSFLELMKRYEPFHIIVCKILKILSMPRQTTFLIYAFLTIAFAYKAMQKQKESISIGYLFFMYLSMFFPYSFNGMRESLAVAIIFYAYSFLKQDCFSAPKAIALSIIAALIHYASMISIPFILLWIMLKKVRKKEIVIVAIYLMIVIMVYAISFLLPKDLNDSNFFYKFLRYLNSNGDIDIGIGLVLIRLPIIAILILFYKKLNKINPDMKFYITLYAISIILMYLGYLNIYLNRFANYFSIIEIVLLTSFLLIPNQKSKHSKNVINYAILAKICLIAYIIIQFVLTFYIGNTGQIFPYDSIIGREIV